MVKRRITQPAREIWLSDILIDNLIDKLNELKENKEHEHFEDLKVNDVIFVHEKSDVYKYKKDIF